MSELYKLPDGWEWKTFDDELILIQNGISDKQNDDGIGYPISRIETIQNETLDSNRIKYIDIDDNTTIYKYKYDYGDLLFSHINSFEKVGKVCLFTNQIENLLHGVNILRMKFTDQVDSKYVFYYLVSNISRRFYEPHIKKAINQASINQKNIKSIPLPLPPLAEQQRIVSKLDALFEEIDKAIALHVKNMEEADAFMGSVLNDVFGELEEKSPKDTFDNIKLSNVIGLVKNTNQQSPFFKYKYVKMNNILNSNGFTFDKIINVDVTSEEINKFSLEKGDFLFNTRNSEELVGKSCIFDYDEKNILYNNNIMRVRFRSDISSYFIAHQFGSSFIKNQLKNIKSGTTNVSAIYYKTLKEIKLIVPPLPIQQKTVTYLDEISQKIEKIKQVQKEKLSSLKALKASILDQAFRGEL